MPAPPGHHAKQDFETGSLRILIINQSFWPDVVATAQQAHDLALFLTAHGNSVTVVASRSLYGQQGATLPARERVDGISVYRVSRNLFRKRGLITRALDFARFGLACLTKCLTIPKQDVVICLTTPPFIALIGVLLQFFKGSRFVIWSMDLYPDLPAQAGIIRFGGFVHRVLRLIDVACLRRADKIVVLGSCMYDRIRAKWIAASRIAMIHPWSDPIEITTTLEKESSRQERNQFRSEWDIGDRFVIEYSGNYGLGHDVDTVARAMLRMKGDDGIRWVIVGDGIMKPSIVSFVNEHRIPNVIFRPYQPRALLGPLIRLGDVHLVLMMPGYEGIILPSKLYGILAAERPAIFVGPSGSEVARVIEREKCGFVVPNGDHERLVELIQQLRGSREQRADLGKRGRTALEQRFSMRLGCASWHQLLLSGLDDRARDRERYQQVAALHLENIASGFLSAMGANFMTILYQTIDESPGGLLEVEREGDRIVGFVAAATNTESLMRGLLTRFPSVVWALRGCLLRPGRLIEIFRLMRHLIRSSRAAHSGLPRTELLSIAVASDSRGKGVAERLYRRLESHLHRRGIVEFKIVVGSNLSAAQRFYDRMGASEVGQVEVHGGHTSKLYVARVRNPASDRRLS